jgi:small subunit ribosomal protein S17
MASETPPAAAVPTTKPERGNRRVLIGVVTRDKMDKTRRVEIQRLVKHPRYGKYQKRRTVCYVHDETNETRNGDTVEIMETRPLSKMKCWRLVRIITKAPRGAAPKAAEIAVPADVTGQPAPQA